MEGGGDGKERKGWHSQVWFTPHIQNA